MTLQAPQGSRRSGGARDGMVVVDADIHPLATAEQLDPWMPERWRKYRPWSARHLKTQADVIRVREQAARSDTFPPGGGPPGSDAAFMVDQLLDRYDIAYGVVNVLAGDAGTGPKGFTEAHCHATNQWIATTLLATDPRWIASLTVPYEFGGDSVVREIERWAHEKRFRQVLLSMRTEKPLGDPKYWAMFEACEALGLAVGIHPGTSGNNSVTGAGWPSFYYEDHVGYPQVVPTHAASMICEGVFDRFPKLQFVVIEGGWSHAAWLGARLDACWRVMRDEVVELERAPSEYLREHFWYTTQPMEEPEDPRWFGEVLERSGVEDRLMFSTDYPHWDFDSPDDAMPATLPRETRSKIFHGNAGRLYGLPVGAA
jgi:predicted TIM-barrel fold metal-dependent hydrolase